MTPSTPAGSGITGLWMAQRREEETRRPSPLFTDPWAELFVAAAGPTAPPRWARPPFMGDYFAVRTRFFDDCLLAAAAAGCLQVVILAAGLDARAFRLPWPARSEVYEIDQPGVLEFKDQVLAANDGRPSCARRHAIAADLRQDWAAALLAADFHPGEPTAWLAEGILMYLTPADGDKLLTTLGTITAPGSRLAIEHARTIGASAPLLRPALATLARLGARWQSAVDDPLAWLAGLGWSATASQPPDIAARYHRSAGLAASAGWLITADRSPGLRPATVGAR
jgi:methyltransferase (TIGR00027 family)